MPTRGCGSKPRRVREKRVRILEEQRRTFDPSQHPRYRISVAETDFHDLHQRAEIGLAAVHRSRHELELLVESLLALVEAGAKHRYLQRAFDRLAPVLEAQGREAELAQYSRMVEPIPVSSPLG